jgi:hypothetical protein
MSTRLNRRSRRLRLGLFACVLPVFANACSGVAPNVVRDSSAAINAEVVLAKASLVSCRGGDHAQCDSAQKNLEAIGSTNAELGKLADE